MDMEISPCSGPHDLLGRAARETGRRPGAVWHAKRLADGEKWGQADEGRSPRRQETRAPRAGGDRSGPAGARRLKTRYPGVPTRVPAGGLGQVGGRSSTPPPQKNENYRKLRSAPLIMAGKLEPATWTAKSRHETHRQP